MPSVRHNVNKWSLLLILLKYVDQDWRCSILKFMYILTVGFYVNKVLGVCALFKCCIFFNVQEGKKENNIKF